MAGTVAEYLEQLERGRADLKHRLDGFEAGDIDRTITDAQRQSAAQYMRRGIAEFNMLITVTKKKIRPCGESIHLF
jgi:hypothetical protein